MTHSFPPLRYSDLVDLAGLDCGHPGAPARDWRAPPSLRPAVSEGRADRYRHHPCRRPARVGGQPPARRGRAAADRADRRGRDLAVAALRPAARRRSEEHTSELQSLMRISYAVFCLNKQINNITL